MQGQTPVSAIALHIPLVSSRDSHKRRSINMEKVGKWASGHLDVLRLIFRTEEDIRMNNYTIIIYYYIYIIIL